jgi:aspartate racemase
MNNGNYKPVLGVIGGMGPIASAQFVLTIYNLNKHLSEQQMPEVHLFSRPGITDRSQAMLEGTFDNFTDALISMLQKVEGSCDRMLICCFTSHNAWSNIPLYLQDKLINLVDYTMDMVRSYWNDKILLIATEGSYKGGWFLKDTPSNLVLLKADDIPAIHALIYEDLKHGNSFDNVYDKFQQYRIKYGCTKILAGCTELHLLKAYMPADETILDPLYEIAGNLRQLMTLKAEQTIS